jgi:hypothetical protein
MAMAALTKTRSLRSRRQLCHFDHCSNSRVSGSAPLGEERIFCYASLASGLDIVRKCLGQHEIATIQTTTSTPANNATDFITQLTFTGTGSFTGTMTPITTAVPEPSKWAMMILGFAGLGFMAYGRNAKPASGSKPTLMAV